MKKILEPKNNILVLKFGEYQIEYVQYLAVLNIRMGNRNISDELRSLWMHNELHQYSHHLYDSELFISEIKKRIYLIYIIAKEIHESNGALYCLLSSHVFECLSTYSQFLRHFHMHQNALNFWLLIWKIVKEWEKENDNFRIHKGTILGFIAEIYMSTLNEEIAFTYLHRAVKEDILIKDYMPGYPKNAPGYQIVTLKGNPNHFMGNYVQNIRKILENDIIQFTEEFPTYKKFNLEQFDEIFIDNELFDRSESLENIKINVAYYFWHIYYYRYKSDFTDTLSDFDNMNRMQKLFGMCVSIESLAKETLGINSKYLKERIGLLYKFLGGNNNFDKLYNKVQNRDESINQLLEELLNFNADIFEEINVTKFDKCVLIYSMVRNFSAHNVKSINQIGDRFFDISRVMEFLFFIFLNKLKN